MKNLSKQYRYLIGAILVLINITACWDLDENVYSEITEDTYNYEAGDATKIVGSSYATLTQL